MHASSWIEALAADLQAVRLRENDAVVIIRCTQKLLRRVGSLEAEAGSSTTRLGDWYANLLWVGRQRLIICVSERARLPVLLRAQDVKNLSRHLPAALPGSIGRAGRTGPRHRGGARGDARGDVSGNG